VNTNRAAASGANPLGLLFFHEAPHSLGPYHPQIVDHAHAVLCSISLIQVTQPLTGEARAVGAEISVLCASRVASLDPAGQACLGLAGIVDPATRALVPVAQKGVTDPAIHAARGDQKGLGRLSFRAFLSHRFALERTLMGA
jgi:hypothetical protein